MPVLKDKYIRLSNIRTAAILADAGCRKGWEKNFPRLLQKVIEGHSPDVFIVAGDLALNAYDKEYRSILRHINATRVPWIAVPGDHDRPLKYFTKYFGSTRKVIDIGKWRFIGINTANRMFLKKEGEWIENNIKPNTIIFSHLPPEADGWTFHSLWPRSSNHFLDLIKKHRKKIKRMYFGHIHGFTERKYLDIPMTVTGAVAESKIVRNNHYDGTGFFEMVIFDTETGRQKICRID